MKKDTIKKICYGVIFTMNIWRMISDCIDTKRRIEEINRLKRKNNRLQSEVDDLEETNEVFIISNIGLTKENTKIKEELEMANAECYALSARIDELDNKIDCYERQINDLKFDLSATEEMLRMEQTDIPAYEPENLTQF